MKRFLPFIGIFLVTTITVIYWFEIKKDKDRAENLKWLEERCSKPVEESFGRNVFLEPPAIEEKFDDFDNTITWKYEMNSWNRVPNQFLRTKFCPDRIPNSSAYLDITCTKYSDKSGKYDLTFKPPANIENNAVEIKWDDMPPKRLSVDRFGTFSIIYAYTESLIKKLDKHSKLRIRYKDWQGTQIAEFALSKDNLIPEIVKKCSWAKN